MKTRKDFALTFGLINLIWLAILTLPRQDGAQPASTIHVMIFALVNIPAAFIAHRWLKNAR